MSKYDSAASVKDNVVSLSDGNPGAATVLTQAVEQHPNPWGFLETLDEMNMYGPRIWLGFKDYCGEDIDDFIECIESQDEEMVEMVNDMKRNDGDDVVTVN